MMKIRTIILFAAAAFTFTTAAQAHDKIVRPDANIQIWNTYDSSISGTVPGVLVRVNGTKTVYKVGTTPGLTRSVVFDATGKKAEAWARSTLGVDVDALTCGGGGQGEARTFTNC